MFTHVVTFRWKDGITAADVAAIGAALDALPGAVPSIRSYRHGPDAGAAAGAASPNFDYAVVATFDDVDGWRAYDADAAHDRVRKEVLGPWIASRAAVQFAS